jgi:hypothetical protein
LCYFYHLYPVWLRAERSRFVFAAGSLNTTYIGKTAKIFSNKGDFRASPLEVFREMARHEEKYFSLVKADTVYDLKLLQHVLEAQ